MSGKQRGWLFTNATRKGALGFALTLLLILTLNMRPGIIGAVPPAPITPETVPERNERPVLYTFDLRDAFLNHASRSISSVPGEPVPGKSFEDLLYDYDLMLFVTTLQGIVNRESPRLYVYHADGVDDFWLGRFQGLGEWLQDYRVEPLPDLAALLEAFRLDVAGTVVWDEDLASTMNLATTIAGVEDMPVIRRTSPLYDQITQVMPVRIDLTGRFASKTEAYRWLIQEYLQTGLSNPRLLAYIEDGWPTTLYQRGILTSGANSIFSRDYIVQHRGFVFDLSPWEDESPVDEPDQPLGEDRAVFEEILAVARAQAGTDMIAIWGFVPWWQKYSNSEGAGGEHEPFEGEWEVVWLTSSYGAYFTGSLGDVFGLDMANSSVHSFAPFPDWTSRPPSPSLDELRNAGYIEGNQVAPKTYLLYYMGDYDFAQPLYTLLPELWQDEARGELPLAWGINPQAVEIVPDILSYMLRTRTPADYFVAADSGAGYLNPEALPEALQASWQDHNLYYYHRLGLSITGFFLNGQGGEAPDNVVDLYQAFSPDGIVFNWHHLVGNWPRLQGNMPLTAFSHYGLSGQDPLEDWIEWVDQGYSDYQDRHGDGGPVFVNLRCVFTSPSFLVTLTEELRQRYPERDFEVVDPYTFFSLMRRELGGRNERRATFLQEMLPEVLDTGETVALQLPVRNDGWETWPAEQVGLGFSFVEGSLPDQVPGASGEALFLPLFEDVAPGEVYTFTFLLGSPLVPGQYTVQYDLLQQPWAWFYAEGNTWRQEGLLVEEPLGGMGAELPPLPSWPTPAPMDENGVRGQPSAVPSPTVAVTATGIWTATESIPPDMPTGWDLPAAVEDGLTGRAIWAIARDPLGRVWFGGEQGVVSFDPGDDLDPDDDTWAVYTPDNGLPHQWVTAIAADAQGGVWFGTQGGGAAYLDDLGWTLYTEQDGLASNWVRDIVVDDQGVVWFATSRGVSAFTGTTWQNLDKSNSPLPRDLVSDIVVGLDGDRWFATEGGGVSRLSADGVNWYNYTESDGLGDDFVLSLAVDGAGYVWAGTWRGGVSFFDGENWWTYAAANSGLASNWVQSVAIDARGRVWCGTYGLPGGGISVLTPATAQWTHYGPDDGLPSDNVTVLAATRPGEMWVGTEQGAIRYLEPLLLLAPEPEPTGEPDPTLPRGVPEEAFRGAGELVAYTGLNGRAAAPRQQSPTPTRQPSPDLSATVPVPLPTGTTTRVPSPTPRESPTPTNTPPLPPTETWTPSPTGQPTATPTNTPPLTDTPTRTPSTTPTRTPSPSPSRTPTQTPSPTGSRTATPTPTRTSTGTPPTATPTGTASSSPTASPTATPEATACIPICPPVCPAPPAPPPPLPTRDDNLEDEHTFTTSWGDVMRVSARPSGNALRVPDTRGAAGRPIKVYINADNLVWVAAIQLEISYDTSMLTAVDVNLTPRSETLSRPGPVVDADSGIVDLLLFSPEGEAIPPGRGPILSLIFEVREVALDDEKAQVHIDRAILSDVDGNEIDVPAHLIFDGYLEICSTCFLHNGDIDKDGDVTVLDVQRGVNIVLGRHIADDEEVVALDINGDSLADVLDVIKVVNLALGREEPPPWEPTPAPFTPTPTAAPVVTPTQTPTITVTPGPTLTPTQTLTPQPSPTPGCVALSALRIVGPPYGVSNTMYVFTATVDPAAVAVPVTYTWIVGDDDPLESRGGNTDELLYTWESTGTFTITVSAINVCGVVVSSTHQIAIVASPDDLPPYPLVSPWMVPIVVWASP